MGCDIHLYAEQKINDRWEHWGEVTTVGRCYELFGIMVKDHIRSECVKGGIVDAKGLPADINPLTAKRLDCDYHTHSWLSHTEINKLKERWRYTEDWLCPWYYSLYDKSWNALERFPKDFRFVFAFDS